MIRALFPELTDERFAELVSSLEAARPERAPDLADALPLLDSYLREWIAAPEARPFQRIIRGLCADAAALFPLREVTACFADPTPVFASFLTRLEWRVRSVSERALVAGLNSCRSRGVLVGATPHDRYAWFVRLCCDEGLERASGLSLPLWRQRCATFPAQEASVLQELCERVTRARDQIQETFGIGADVRLVGLGADSGDRHHHGRSVSVLRFADGSSLVYKPRSVSCEAGYAGLVADMNARYGTHLMAATALDLGDHGFVEFVDAAQDGVEPPGPLDAMAELLAVMFLLNARDMHHENVIATDRGPIPIDLETLLHPDAVNSEFADEPFDSAYLASRRGVGMTGLLPFAVGRADSDDWVDLGFLGADPEGGNAPLRAITFSKPFTDETTLSLDWVPLQPRARVQRSAPRDEVVLQGTRLAAGFGEVVHRVLQDKEHFVALVTQRFADASVRYIHNPTWLYGQILRQSTAALALESADITASLLRRVALQTNSADLAIVHDEVAQLWAHDIPYFQVRASERAIRNDGGHLVGLATRHSPLSGVIDKIDRLSKSDVQTEQDAIAMAFIARLPGSEARPTPGESAAGPESTSNGLRHAARALAHDLLAGLRPGRRPGEARNWMGPGVGSHAARPWAMAPLGSGLYMGAPGPALALLAWGVQDDDQACREAASQVLDAWSTEALASASAGGILPSDSVGVHNGLGGIAWALDVATTIEPRPRWAEAATAIWRVIAAHRLAEPPQTANLDLLDGLAGTVLALGAVGGRQELRDVLELRLATSLLVQHDRPDGPFRYSGAAHGIAGCLAALAPAGDRSDEHRAAVALLWERLEGFFDSDAAAWWSSRTQDAALGEVWCHGAPGILQGLVAARVNGLSLPNLDDRLAAAINATQGAGFGKAATWCHGDLGNWDILADASRRLGHACGAASIAPELGRASATWLSAGQLLGCASDRAQRYSYSQGAMVGRAGIVFHLVSRLGGPSVSPLRLTGVER